MPPSWERARSRRKRLAGCGLGCLVALLGAGAVAGYLVWRVQGAWGTGVSLVARAIPENELTLVRMLNARDAADMRKVAGPQLATPDAQLAEALAQVRKRCGFVTHVVPRGLSGSGENPLDPRAELSTKLEVRGRSGSARWINVRLRSDGSGWTVSDLVWNPDAPEPPPAQ